ncbi:MAG: Crp/Fnr family transcriptional regulator [Betaproteobacteria bacterium]|nr:Crp/Fnr family transcriptional regulator [Betaproteobacteria bacterium]
MRSNLESKRGAREHGSRLPSLLGLQDEELDSLSAHAKLQLFPRHKIVVTEGDHTNSVYVIHTGKVKVFLYGKNGKEIDLNILGPGEYFGEMVLDSGPRSASVMTLEPSEFFIIPQGVFRDFVIKHPEFAMRLIKTLIFRTRGLLNNVRSLASLDVYGRVARLLLDLAGEEDGKLVINGKLTKQEIANRVGASREMISRVFKDLSVGGYVELQKGKITIARNLPEHW